MKNFWDLSTARKSRARRRRIFIIATGIVVGIGIGLLLPPGALRIPGSNGEPRVSTPIIPDLEATRPRREDTPLAPPPAGESYGPPSGTAPSEGNMVSARFGMCGSGGGRNCVVDGDTFRHRGEKIRIADIDTPELNPSRCAAEEELGLAAKNRLRDLLNAGPFSLEPIQGRDGDDYGRKLRVVVRDGRSIGDQLVAEGLARTWTGRREPWC